MIVLADLDETLISVKSMLRFAEYIVSFGPRTLGSHVRSFMQDLRERKLPRAEANSQYFRMFAGVCVDELTDLGRGWYSFESRQDSFYHSVVVSEIQTRRAEGAEVWIVSGSLGACVSPVAESIGAVGFLCAEQEVSGGLFTGHLAKARIGVGKALAAAEILNQGGSGALHVWAYADHVTDIPMLAMADTAVAVNPDPQLEIIAKTLHWRVIDSKSGQA